jgi:glycosyltransferase involved in cell wall biosynthesis
MAGVPCAIHFREAASRTAAWRVLGTIAAATATRTVAISRYVQTLLPDRLRERSTVIHDAIAIPAPVDRAATRSQLGVPADAPLAVAVGRFTTWKGQRELAAAWVDVRRAVPDARLVLIGAALTPSGEAYLASVRAAAGDGVVIAGERDDAPACIAAADLLIHAPTSPEPFGRVILEAMAAGTPALALNRGGPAEIIEHGVTGWLLTHGDPVALASEAAVLLRDPVRARRVVAAALARVRAAYDPHAHATAIADQLDAMVVRRGS